MSELRIATYPQRHLSNWRVSCNSSGQSNIIGFPPIINATGQDQRRAFIRTLLYAQVCTPRYCTASCLSTYAGTAERLPVYVYRCASTYTVHQLTYSPAQLARVKLVDHSFFHTLDLSLLSHA
jgi:hypothetical protein